jgi:Leucine-rich repeat (LRR) protein
MLLLIGSFLLNAVTFSCLHTKRIQCQIWNICDTYQCTSSITIKLKCSCSMIPHLSSVCLQLLSDEFTELDSLEDLQLGHNQLISLNGSLAPLRSLRCLNLTNNLLQEFSLQDIQGLRRLRIIDLSYNKISHLSGRMEVYYYVLKFSFLLVL